MIYLIMQSLPHLFVYWGIPVIALFIVLRMSPIAANAFKETVRQPYFLVLVFISLFLVAIVANLPLFTSQEDVVRMVRDMGITTATLCGLIVALFSASTSITEEIDKKTAMTVLSKPVTRGRFIVGKYFGIVATSGLEILIVGLGFILLMNHFTVRPMQGEYLSATDPLKRQAVINRLILARSFNVKLMSYGLFLSFLQVAVVTGICVALATRLGTVLNVVLTATIYVVGHIGNWLYVVIQESKAGVMGQAGTLVGAVARRTKVAEVQAITTWKDIAWKVFYAVFPNLENFNAALSLGAGKVFESRLIDAFKYKYYLPRTVEMLIPSVPDFILANIVYAVVYIGALLIIAVLLLRKREIG